MILSVTYLANVFVYLNNLNKSIQSPSLTNTNALGKLSLFLAKLSFWKKRLKDKKHYAKFTLLEKVLLQRDTKIDTQLSFLLNEEFINRSEILQTPFYGNFSL